MMIEPIGSVAPLAFTKPAEPATRSNGFAQMLGDAVGHLQATQSRSDELTTQLANGLPVDLHDVVLAAEEASLTMQLAVQVRNKVVEAYQEIMRMQV